MVTFDVEITYSHDGDIYVADLQVDARDEDAAEEMGRSIFIAQKNVYDDIREVKAKEIPLGI